MPDASTVVWIAGGMGVALTGLGTWAWGHTHKRIDDAWKAIDDKADDEELTRQRDNTAEVFDRLGQVEVSCARIEATLAGIKDRMK